MILFNIKKTNLTLVIFNHYMKKALIKLLDETIKQLFTISEMVCLQSTKHVNIYGEMVNRVKYEM